jgi:hypothetical protein
MRSKKPLISLLRKLVDILEDEATRNPAFSSRLDEVIAPFLEIQEPRVKPSSKRFGEELPDVHSELAERGDSEFRSWLRAQPVEVLRAIIRREDLDAARRASKWKDEGKLADFIADGLRSRMSRGFAFIDRERASSTTSTHRKDEQERDSGEEFSHTARSGDEERRHQIESQQTTSGLSIELDHSEKVSDAVRAQFSDTVPRPHENKESNLGYRYFHDAEARTVYRLPTEPRVYPKTKGNGPKAEVIGWTVSMEIEIVRADNKLDGNRWLYPTSDFRQETYAAVQHSREDAVYYFKRSNRPKNDEISREEYEKLAESYQSKSH